LQLSYSPVRAQIFTYCFLALSIYLLERARILGRPWGLMILIPLQILWANLHGGFLAGLGMIFLYALGQALTRRSWPPYLLTLVPATLVTLINPYGVEYWSYIYQAVTMPRPQITEWASLWTVLLNGKDNTLLVYIGLTIAFTLCIALRTKGQDFTSWLVLAVTALLGIKHQRHLAFFLLAAGSYLPPFFNTYIDKWAELPKLSSLWDRLGKILPTMVLSAVSLVLFIPWINKSPWTIEVPAAPDEKNPIYYPTGALSFIKAHQMSGKVLTEFDWGEYLLWNLYPQCLIAIDGRFETVYPPEVCEKYWDFKYARQDWRGFLTDYRPDFILIYRHSKVYPLLSREPGWQEIYGDEYTALFGVRDGIAYGREGRGSTAPPPSPPAPPPNTHPEGFGGGGRVLKAPGPLPHK